LVGRSLWRRRRWQPPPADPQDVIYNIEPTLTPLQRPIRRRIDRP
jgi:hypothetical protein